jgi:plasmid stabilization system protein ParE
MKVFWRPAAMGDLERLLADAGTRSATEVMRQKAAVESKILLLERHRDMGRKNRRPGVREMPVEGTRYIVVNRRADNEVLILRVFEAQAAF